MITDQESKAFAGQLASALSDINAVRRDLKALKKSSTAAGAFDALLERAAVGIEGVRIQLRTK